MNLRRFRAFLILIQVSGCNISENLTRHKHCCENCKFHFIFYTCFRLVRKPSNEQQFTSVFVLHQKPSVATPHVATLPSKLPHIPSTECNIFATSPWCYRFLASFFFFLSPLFIPSVRYGTISTSMILSI